MNDQQKICELNFIETDDESARVNWLLEINNQRLKRKIYELSFTEIDEPTRVNWLLGGHTSASVVLVSGHYDTDDKAIRGKDSDGIMYYIPRRNIQSIG